jgi:hypothetical protein
MVNGLLKIHCHTGFILEADAATWVRGGFLGEFKLSKPEANGSRSAELFYGNCGIAIVLMMAWMDPPVALIGTAIAAGLIIADQRYARSAGRKRAAA